MEGALKLTNLTMSLLAVVPLVGAGCPGDDGSMNETTDGGESTTSTSMDTSTSAPMTTTGMDTTADGGSTSTGDEPWPEFDCEGVDGVLEGNLLVESAADLAMLEGIAEITGSVEMNETDVTDLDAFGCVTRIYGNLTIFNNDQLTNIDGLVNLTELGAEDAPDFAPGNLVFSQNDGLTDFDGLQSLTRIRGSFSMNENTALTQISGFDSLVGIDVNITIRDNDALTNIDGLKGLMVVGGVLAITANPMLCITSVDCVGMGITVPAMPPPSWSTAANDNTC